MIVSAHVFHSDLSVLAFFQGTQLSLFERFLTQAVAGINSTSITSGMQNVAYVVLLIGFLWQVYQSALHGGDVRGLSTGLIKYVVTAIVVMNYGTVFTTVNQGFVNGGNWISNASGAGNLFENWANDLQTQFNQVGFQQMWGLVTGSIAGLLDAILILIAYILYPIVIVIFGFFYIFYGSVLYIFGPIVIALMPLGATNRIAKSYVENVFIWNSWPILYGGFGALLSAVQMGQVGQMLNQNNFLGGLGNLEGSFLVGMASIIFSLAIAVIPFIAKRIVTGDVGSTAGALIGSAMTAVTAGAAAFEGAAAGVASGGATSAVGSQAGGSAGTASAGGVRPMTSSTGSNQPNPPQPPARADAGHGNQPADSSPSFSGSSTADGHAEQIRSAFSDAMGVEQGSNANVADESTTTSDAAAPVSSGAIASSALSGRPPASRGSGPSVHRYNIGTWGAYHAARLATRTVTRAAGLAKEE
ncbi:Type IV secretory pathway, VirB6 components [Granulicella rosea]|uniref:Type IV secretory pathway, VirB6 components n=1 Tax=Granulicella rosea TaxID=474952 RepID=A0A239E6Q9_9BACT|nr:hypothetical protein [Granulicella rosea]SNS40440.1 Type IV secretory pathway, VirB6 components [Granulicella rosea]